MGIRLTVVVFECTSCPMSINPLQPWIVIKLSLPHFLCPSQSLPSKEEPYQQSCNNDARDSSY